MGQRGASGRAAALKETEDDPRAAEGSLRRAIAVAREQGARWLELRATTSLARLGLPPGTRAATRRGVADDLARVLACFTDGTDSPDLRDARQVLAEQRGDEDRCRTNS